MLERIRFRLAIPAETYLRHYRGDAHAVSVIAEDGRRIQFPATVLRGFVSSEGVYGRFELVFNEQNKLVEILKISE
ncbi:DUF2835 domain-containing protein [Solemya velesiana gill symbiont]|uniref:Topoisomerase II n=1 Tax=Solemya velesiana gill symbiont TaxID=1918948 RepID=A0A1T2KV67_9GAMM|nr:DUF2835 domain-containing protein [Solemya velesiana gill symbiont]OOZ36616.1 hypothetical protein BOW51_06380 [Solemya velesiana gill symbiont]